MGRKRYPESVKQSAVERMRIGVNVSELAQSLGVSREALYVWRRRASPGNSVEGGQGEAQDEREHRIGELEAEVAGLEGALGRAALETRFFKGALRRIEESRQRREETGGTASMPKSAAGSGRKAD